MREEEPPTAAVRRGGNAADRCDREAGRGDSRKKRARSGGAAGAGQGSGSSRCSRPAARASRGWARVAAYGLAAQRPLRPRVWRAPWLRQSARGCGRCVGGGPTAGRGGGGQERERTAAGRPTMRTMRADPARTAPSPHPLPRRLLDTNPEWGPPPRGPIVDILIDWGGARRRQRTLVV